MGGKRIVKRNENLICTAGCLILVILLSGCQYRHNPQLFSETPEDQAGRQHLQKATELAGNGDFKAALVENKKAYDFFPLQLKQEAIFQKVLLYVHPDNPEQNHKKAMMCFERLYKNPNKPTTDYNAALILPILKESCDFANKVSSNNKKSYENEKTLRKKQKILKKKQTAMNKKQTAIENLKKEQKQLKQYIAKLRRQIEQLKEIDLSSSKDIQGVLNE